MAVGAGKKARAALEASTYSREERGERGEDDGQLGSGWRARYGPHRRRDVRDVKSTFTRATVLSERGQSLPVKRSRCGVKRELCRA